jgi:Spy/CpxP family protein refolding chaperone
MKKRPIATTLILASLLIGGMTACSQPDSENVGQANTSTSQSDQAQATPADQTQSNSSDQAQATPSDQTESNTPSSQERANRRQVIRGQIEAVLTPEQKQELETQLQQGQKMRQVLPKLNLTPDQKQKIHEIMKAARAQRQQQQSQSN